MSTELTFAKELRSSYRAMIPSAGTPDTECEIKTIHIPTNDVEYSIPVHLYIPKHLETESLPVVVFAHGGCFVAGDLETHVVMAHTIANGAKAIVAYVDYRLAPEHPFPAGLNDIYTAIEWISNNANQIEANPNKIAVCGDSAGANLATVVTMMARDKNGPQIVGQWLIYLYAASLDMNTASWKELGDTNFPTKEVFISSMNGYIPNGTNSDLPYIAPLNGNHKNLPPAFIQVGELDPLLDENKNYNKALIEAGVKSEVCVYNNQYHGFIQFFKNNEQNSEGLKAINEGIQFLNLIFNN
ncbi:alpha/beta hydrolase [Flavobacterium sp. H122]|uniref:alpha/beta hydrolase n=1 Tax=Flavobacterium sp. H122 TaxID=2529860 RepID=UPI0010A9B133|nr:alpha/beta hydrolase [Flavobacterium sp. H122]